MTWKELKEFCNGLPENVLGNKVIVWREYEAITDIEAETLKEDQYIGEDDPEGCYSLSDAGLELSDIDDMNLKKVYSVGDPILSENF